MVLDRRYVEIIASKVTHVPKSLMAPYVFGVLVASIGLMASLTVSIKALVVIVGVAFMVISVVLVKIAKDRRNKCVLKVR